MRKTRFDKLVQMHELGHLPIRFGADTISILVIYERLLRRSVSIAAYPQIYPAEQVYVVWKGQEEVCELTETYDEVVDNSLMHGLAPGTTYGIKKGVPLFKALLSRKLDPYAIVMRNQFPLYRGPGDRHIPGDFVSHFAVLRCKTKNKPWYPIAISLQRSSLF